MANTYGRKGINAWNARQISLKKFVCLPKLSPFVNIFRKVVGGIDGYAIYMRNIWEIYEICRRRVAKYLCFNVL